MALGGQSQVTFSTTQGPRVVDQLAPGGVANEGKVGYVTYDAATALQVSKDADDLARYSRTSGLCCKFEFFDDAGRLVFER